MIEKDMPTDLTPVSHRVDREMRRQRYGHEGAVIWLTGLSASGKTTLAMRLEQQLLALNCACYTLDGDNIRHGLNADLGFSPEDRSENIRRIGEVAALFADAGLVCIAAFISPYRLDRARAKAAVGPHRFHEIHVAADLATCESRDPKGLYRKARTKALPAFTGIDAPYEEPTAADLVLDTAVEHPDQSLQRLFDYVRRSLGL